VRFADDARPRSALQRAENSSITAYGAYGYAYGA